MLWIKTDISEYKERFTSNTKLNKFWDFYFSFPQFNRDFLITLGEGGTPCKDSLHVGENLGLTSLSFKDETLNPTNSFKDRAAALLISHARSWGYNKVVCASNGNQGASIAAYTSLEGMESITIIPKKIDIGKRAQLIAYNSEIIVEGDIVDEALEKALDKKYSEDYYQCTSEFNPLTIEAQKTIAFEIFIEKGVPDWIIIPMGNGGCLVSIWKGFRELKESGLIDHLPKLVGVQSELCAPIVDKYDHKESSEVNEEGLIQSQALGVMVKKPLYQSAAIKAINDSKGTAIAILESLLIRSVADLARYEGIFAEPASALTLAALINLLQQNKIGANDNIVCLITGSGLKAPYVLEAISSRAKTAGMGSILSTKVKILAQISRSGSEGIYGSRLKEIIGSVSLAAIYQHLKSLEEKELITRKKIGKNVYYSITDVGKKVLDALDILITLF